MSAGRDDVVVGTGHGSINRAKYELEIWYTEQLLEGVVGESSTSG